MVGYDGRRCVRTGMPAIFSGVRPSHTKPHNRPKQMILPQHDARSSPWAA